MREKQNAIQEEEMVQQSHVLGRWKVLGRRICDMSLGFQILNFLVLQFFLIFLFFYFPELIILSLNSIHDKQ